MGMYDTVLAPCPRCGVRVELQSKSGPCRLDTFDLDDAPVNVLMGIDDQHVEHCLVCGAGFKIHVKTIAIAKTILVS